MDEKKTKVANAVTPTDKAPLKLARAQYNVMDSGSQDNIYLTNSNDLDIMDIPKDPQKLIKLCRFFYKHDPIAGTVMNKMVDCAISALDNRKAGCTDEEFETYNSLNTMLENFYRAVCLEYLLSGLVLPDYEWVTKKGSDLSPELNSRRRLTVPDNIWFRDPASVTVKNSPIPNKKYYYVTVDTNTITFIKSKGKLADGSFDTETYNDFVKNFPAFVKKVQESKGTNLLIRLEDVRPILSRCLPEDTYPTPYMTNALEALVHKRNLRKMDYSIASRVIAAIQLIKLGSDLFPCTDEGDFDYIKEQMSFRSVSGYHERIFQLFANHTLSIEWVFPDTQAMMNREKYTSVEDDIIAGLGFPRTLITGETLRSNVAGGSDFAAFSPIATMEAIRAKLIDWTRDLYKEVRDRNDFKNMPIPAFTPMKLYKLLDLNVIGMALYQEGSLSRETRLEMIGLNLDTEIERKKNEKDLYKKNGLDEAPVMPFSSPNIGKKPGSDGAPPAAKPKNPQMQKPATPKAPGTTTPKAKAEGESEEEPAEE